MLRMLQDWSIFSNGNSLPLILLSLPLFEGKDCFMPWSSNHKEVGATVLSWELAHCYSYFVCGSSHTKFGVELIYSCLGVGQLWLY